MTKQYQVLARKYRPQKFTDVVAQENILTTLKNALQFDQIAHAYLFSGPRGVGKTTLARLFAKALNCYERSSDLEPCNSCPSCLDILSGQSLDVIEFDGASHRGIDDIRQINETVSYAPTYGKYKIYIIDEVHMLTKEAFNALLKTLEEPPEKAKFFFATTEPHKVLPTIVSRCQRFDLSRIDPKQIASKLSQIGKDLGREVEQDALDLIALHADGSLRDAESLFDQILCFSSSRIDSKAVRHVLGLIPEEYLLTLDEAFAEGHLPYAFELVQTIFQAGKDLGHFLRQLVDHYRSICLCKTMPVDAAPPHIHQKYGATAARYTAAQAFYILELLIQAEQTIQKSSFPRAAIESTLVHLIRSKQRIPIEVIARRLHQVEEALKKKTDQSENSTIELQKPVDSLPSHAVSVFEKRQSPESEDSTIELQKPLDSLPSHAVSVFEKKQSPESEDSTIELQKPLDSLPSHAVSVFEKKQSLELELPKEPPLPQTAPSVFAPLPELNQEPSALEETAPIKKANPSSPSVFAPLTDQGPAPKHTSHYETMLRFAAIELEGTLIT